MRQQRRLLVGCETSGKVREAFRAKGWEAFSCDLLPADDGSPYHLQMDVLDALRHGFWHLVIVHPPCTYLTGSGLHWNKRRPERAALTEEALRFTEKIWAHRRTVGAMALENPVGCLSTRSSLGKPSQIIQPYDFGDDASKKTCLWLSNLPPLPLDPAKRCPGRLVTLPSGKTVERWSNQTDSGQNSLPPSADRWKKRSETFPGISAAMAEAWG